MAEDKDESQEKSQEPTARRLEKAREDGKVLSSKEGLCFYFNVNSWGITILFSPYVNR